MNPLRSVLFRGKNSPIARVLAGFGDRLRPARSSTGRYFGNHQSFSVLVGMAVATAILPLVVLIPPLQRIRWPERLRGRVRLGRRLRLACRRAERGGGPGRPPRSWVRRVLRHRCVHLRLRGLALLRPRCSVLADAAGGSRRRGHGRPAARRPYAEVARRLSGDRDPRLRRDRAGRLPQRRQVHERDQRHQRPLPAFAARGRRLRLHQPVALLHNRGGDHRHRHDAALSAPGLSARAGPGWHPRRRTGGRQHGHQHRDHEAARLRDRGIHLRPGRRLLRVEALASSARASSASPSASRCWQWSFSVAWATSGEWLSEPSSSTRSRARASSS